MKPTVPKAFAPKRKTQTQLLLNKTRFVSRNKDGTARIVRDNYHNADQTWWTMQKRVYDRDDNRCRSVFVKNGIKVRCTHCKPDHKLEVHHIIPLSRGGKTTMTNLILICLPCHNQRHAHLKGRT